MAFLARLCVVSQLYLDYYMQEVNSATINDNNANLAEQNIIISHT